MADGSATITLVNGRIRASAHSPQLHESMAVRDGRVVWIGTTESLPPASAETVDLRGSMVMPGLIDAHLHLDQYARSLELVDCELPSLTDCLSAVHERAAQLPPGSWVLGHGWNQNDWGGYGSLQALDQAVPDHPAYLTAKSLHAAWVNTAALERAAIDRDTPDPSNGRIQRGPDHAPSGILFEGAMQLVRQWIPAPGTDELADLLVAAQGRLNELGIVAVHDFDGPTCFAALQVVRERGALALRVVKNIPLTNLDEAQSLGLRSGFGDDWIRIGNIKVFADGALGPRTASMLEPYATEPDNLGMLLVDGEQLSEIGIQAAEAGFGMTVHAIGDRANHEVLNAFAVLRDHEQRHALPARRHRIEHLQLVHADDRLRPQDLDVIASMQPIHATSDMLMADRYWGDRVRYAYAWKTQLDAGAVLAFGSDAPVEDPNPWRGLHAAVTRSRAGEHRSWTAAECLPVAEAFAAYTEGAAFAAGMERNQGRLEPGYLADLIVLERDPYQLDPAELADVQPLGTMVGGEWRHRAF